MAKKKGTAVSSGFHEKQRFGGALRYARKKRLSSGTPRSRSTTRVSRKRERKRGKEGGRLGVDASQLDSGPARGR